jgi:uncharacterized membrane protein
VRDLFLWLHIAIAIVAFGPTFTFPVWTAMARRTGGPAIPYAIGTIRRLLERVILPLAVVMPFTGVVLIYVGRFDLWGTPWLLVAIALYTIAFGIAAGLSLPNVRRMLSLFGPEMTDSQRAEVMARADRQRIFGYTNSVLILVIVFLMVAKPGG